MNAPLGLIPGRAPKPGAIYLSESSALGRAGEWIQLDEQGGGIINLSSGATLPMGMQRGGSPMQFGSPLAPTDVHTPVAIAGYLSPSTPARCVTTGRTCWW